MKADGGKIYYSKIKFRVTKMIVPLGMVPPK
jgi:hypothetical protein